MIDYSLINKSIEYYSFYDFERIETPWLVTEAVDSITRPESVQPYIIEAKNKNLIASGEQGFLYLYLKEYLPKGRFQTTTPCFRNDSFDYTHTKYFIKNELIDTKNTTKENLLQIVEIANYFFNNRLNLDTDIVKTEDGFDIMAGDYELGSYGIRECRFLKWIYGTACAEPRTSKLIKLYNGIS